jgi:hypothetical protein
LHLRDRIGVCYIRTFTKTAIKGRSELIAQPEQSLDAARIGAPLEKGRRA